MLMLFTCEHCGKRIQVNARMQGRKGRCQQLRAGDAGSRGSMRGIRRRSRPRSRPMRSTTRHAPAHPHGPTADAPFQISAPEPRPEVGATYFNQPPVLTEPEHLHRHVGEEAPSEFELLVDDARPDDAVLASPEVQRGIRELEDFKKDPGPYKLADDLDSRFFRWAHGSRAAGWVYTQWRRGVGLILRVLRFIDDWAYLISVPFLIVMIFGVAIAHRGLVHTGAAVVVLVNFGRFWTDLLALFVRPFKEGPMHGLLFLFPPYGVYFVRKHWDAFQSTFRRLATSCIPIILVILAYAFIPTIDPEIKKAPNLPERLRRAGQDVVKEAQRGPARGARGPEPGRPEAAGVREEGAAATEVRAVSRDCCPGRVRVW